MIDANHPLYGPIIVAAIAALATVAAAAIAKLRPRADPFERANILLDQYQEDRAADRAQLETLERKLDASIARGDDERAYSSSWEEWHAAGMPDPPGRPYRKNHITREGPR
ncbi:hypothetical protein [Arthrobacter sp. 31Y]|uniref:hypothetical protein n=1 Tax=Arthrobacter sp. 31Y TaxID=1115632 RepID=UPI000464BD0A|nr:hypothetical protein [Arthrobacter sp. 31Y]